MYGCLIILAIAACCGCAGDKNVPAMGELKGKITLDDMPLKAGRLRALNEDGRSSEIGTVQPGGEYVLTNVPVGNVTVVFIPPPSIRHLYGEDGKPVSLKKDINTRPKVTEEKKLARFKEAEKIPPRYFDREQSDLTTTVSIGSNEFDMKLTTR